MVWIYGRNSESLTLETRYDNDAADYVLIIRRPDEAPQTERFADSAVFRERLVALERDLEAEHWAQVGPPVFLRDGWRIS